MKCALDALSLLINIVGGYLSKRKFDKVLWVEKTREMWHKRMERCMMCDPSRYPVVEQLGVLVG